ncbi:SDR family NAD(P)-dependent oxidoreductase [Streptomyces fuscigenes]|uniref:SDR family NAD(P)-dependent oxidoreductase n=1 Tax=Streptomyces fuscigenes TaxID=1528880 RepID=UPI001F3AF3BF|nr:SDR family oxidoreductase [Streptomyces fuscigenes]MCF3963779.1 SDR family oxidoreductase [Streptomyces fuscigenes]
MDLQLAGRRALVTGGSRGIGLAVGRLLAREGAAVALVARNEVAVKEAAAAVSAETGGLVVGIAADTGDDEAVAAMAADARQLLGGDVDILVNNAATASPGAFPEDELEAQINVKVRGYLRTTRALAPAMTEHGWGRIINIAGLAARLSGSVVGSVRNVAVAAMTKNLADELGPQGVNVTVVHPGMTRTETQIDAIARRAADRGVGVEQVERELAASVSIGRIVEPDEVAAVVAFLASPLSAALNGDPLVPSGGARGAIHY